MKQNILNCEKGDGYLFFVVVYENIRDSNEVKLQYTLGMQMQFSFCFDMFCLKDWKRHNGFSLFLQLA